MKHNTKSQVAIFNLLLFGGALIVYAILFPVITDVIESSKNQTTDSTAILIYDVLPFAIGILIIIGFVGSIIAVRGR